MSVENIIFDVAESLRYPVLILAILAIVVVLLELGALIVEARARRRRGMPRLERGLDVIRAALRSGDRDGAARSARKLGFNRSMSDVLAAIVEQSAYPDADDRIAKRMAEYDYRSMKRLERTRILVRAGPALGLMGTLIPLSPALAALAEGDVTRLTVDLRVAFSVTVAGLLIGMVAFAVSLVRDRFYSQDYSDVEYAQAALAAALASAPKPVSGSQGVSSPAGSSSPTPSAPAAIPPPAPAAPLPAAASVPGGDGPTQETSPGSGSSRESARGGQVGEGADKPEGA